MKKIVVMFLLLLTSILGQSVKTTEIVSQNKYNSASNLENMYWTQVWDSTQIPDDWQAGAFNSESNEFYIISKDRMRIYVYNFTSETMVVRACTNPPIAYNWDHFGEAVYDRNQERILLKQYGLNKIFAVSINGGSWTQVGDGTPDWERFGAPIFFNPVSSSYEIFAGYGYNTMKNSIYSNSLNGQGWIEIRQNSNDGNPPRGHFSYCSDSSGANIYIFGSLGNLNGSQYNCSLTYWYNSDYCWIRGMWKINLADHSISTILPLDDPKIEIHGTIVYNYKNKTFYTLHGRKKPTTGNVFSDGETFDDVYKFTPGQDETFGLVSTLGQKPKINVSLPILQEGVPPYRDYGGYSLYDAQNNRIMLFRFDGVWALSYTQSTPLTNFDNWKIIVNGSTQSLSDQLNYAGVDSLATEGYDPSLDTPNPPTPPGNYIDAYFYHPEWNSPLGSKFASDVKQSTDLADTVKRWFFEVETNVLNDTVKLQFTQENVPSKFGKYLTDMQTGKRVDLRYTDTYKYYNTSTSPRKFQLIIGDSTSPVISNLIPKGDEIWRSNTNKTVSWTMSDGTGIDTVFLYSSNNNGANFNRFASIGNISNYNWSIPQEYLNNGYRVKTVVRDSLGNESEIISPLAFTVVGDSLLTQSYAGWNLTGTPLLPNDTTLAGILGDDIVSSPYFVWAYSLSTGYTIPLGLSFGTGYWLGLLNNHTWDVRGTAVESDSTGQSLNLGYNLISTKYVREVSKDRMTFVKSGTSYSFNSAVTAGLISNAIFTYNGSGYVEEDTLSLFGGYWLGVLQEGVTLYQKPVSTQLPLSKGNQEPELFTENNWKLRFNAESGIQSDNITEIGVTEAATAGYDAKYDAARPPVPPIDKFIEIYSEVSGTGYPQFLGNKYARDFKDTPNWTLKVKKGNTGSEEVTINWNRNELGNIPDGMRITMTDLTTGQTIDMRRDSSYSFTYSEERTFLINGTATGIEDATIAPTDFSLSQNYPNPFNPSTKIRYSLPEESRVKITVYNSLGEMVKIMTNGTAQRGWYETSFDATQIPSGIYFAKIEAQSLQSNKQFIRTIKMLLIK